MIRSVCSESCWLFCPERSLGYEGNPRPNMAKARKALGYELLEAFLLGDARLEAIFVA